MTEPGESNSWPSTRPRGRNGICRRCGEPCEMTLGTIVQTIRKAGKDYRAGASITLCETHALELWATIHPLIESYRNVK